MAGHAYVQGVPLCSCADAEEHAPCLMCGAGRTAFQHEADQPAPAADVSAGDLGDGTEKH